MSIFKSISGFFSGLFSGSSSGSSSSGWGPDNNLFESTLVNPTTGLPMIGGMGGIDAGGNLWCEDPEADYRAHHDLFDDSHNSHNSFDNNFDDHMSSTFDDHFDSSFNDDFSSGFDDPFGH